MKRSFDIAISALALILLAPLLLALALAVRLRGGAGPVIFRQERAGRDAAPFDILKFRTMTKNAEHTGAGLAIEKDDPRITSIGKLLRATSLDELPQLWNVLKGDMSLVGPRPLPMKYVPRYSAEQRRRLEALPGITGLAQVRGRNTRSWEDKFRDDVEYVDSHTFWGDLKIIVLTAVTMVRREGVTGEEGEVKEFMGTAESAREA